MTDEDLAALRAKLTKTQAAWDEIQAAYERRVQARMREVRAEVGVRSFAFRHRKCDDDVAISLRVGFETTGELEVHRAGRDSTGVYDYYHDDRNFPSGADERMSHHLNVFVCRKVTR